MEFIKLTARDGARVEVNPANVLYFQKSPNLEEEFVEVHFVGGDKLLVRQKLDLIMKLAGVERPGPKPKEAAASVE